jgi:hypothetical protein
LSWLFLSFSGRWPNYVPIGVSVVVQFVCVVVVVVVVLLLLLLVVVAALLVGYFAVTNGTFSALYVGLYLPLCRVFSFLLIKSLLIIKKDN